MFRLLMFHEMLHITFSLVKQELLCGRKMISEHKVPFRGTAFCFSQMQRAPQVQISKVTSAGICTGFSHTTVIIAKGLCANRCAIPEGTTERKHPIQL